MLAVSDHRTIHANGFIASFMKFLKQQPLSTTIVLFAAIWSMAFWPARTAFGGEGVYWLTAACLIVAVPALAILAWERFLPAKDPLAAMMGQMGIRMATLIAAVLVVKSQWPDVTFTMFYGWLVLFYSAALIVEAFVLQDRMRDSKMSLSSLSGASDS